MKAQSLANLMKLMCIAVLSGFFSVARPILLSRDDPHPVELGSHYHLLVDNRDSFTIKDSLSPNNQAILSKLQGGSPNFSLRRTPLV